MKSIGYGDHKPQTLAVVCKRSRMSYLEGAILEEFLHCVGLIDTTKDASNRLVWLSEDGRAMLRKSSPPASMVFPKPWTHRRHSLEVRVLKTLCKKALPLEEVSKKLKRPEELIRPELLHLQKMDLVELHKDKWRFHTKRSERDLLADTLIEHLVSHPKGRNLTEICNAIGRERNFTENFLDHLVLQGVISTVDERDWKFVEADTEKEVPVLDEKRTLRARVLQNLQEPIGVCELRHKIGATRTSALRILIRAQEMGIARQLCDLAEVWIDAKLSPPAKLPDFLLERRRLVRSAVQVLVKNPKMSIYGLVEALREKHPEISRRTGEDIFDLLIAKEWVIKQGKSERFVLTFNPKAVPARYLKAKENPKKRASKPTRRSVSGPGSWRVNYEVIEEEQWVAKRTPGSTSENESPKTLDSSSS